jgi:hypothetical protein
MDLQQLSSEFKRNGFFGVEVRVRVEIDRRWTLRVETDDRFFDEGQVWSDVGRSRL